MYFLWNNDDRIEKWNSQSVYDTKQYSDMLQREFYVFDVFFAFWRLYFKKETLE